MKLKTVHICIEVTWRWSLSAFGGDDVGHVQEAFAFALVAAAGAAGAAAVATVLLLLLWLPSVFCTWRHCC